MAEVSYVLLPHENRNTFIFLDFSGVCFFSAQVFSSSGEVSVKNSRSGDYDFLVYAVTWQPSFCVINQLKAFSNNFKVHGIWPYFKSPAGSGVNNYHPSYCFNSPGCRSFRDCPIDETALHFLARDDRLQALYPQGSDSLFPHEWQKHGTCSGLSQVDYFKLASDYEKKIDTGKVLARLKERKEQLIDRNDILRRLPENTSLWCKNYQGVDYLYEIHYFLGKNGTGFFQTDTQIGSPCPEKFRAPFY